MASHGAEIPTAIPKLSTMPDLNMSLRTLPDIVSLPKFKMTAISVNAKRGVEGGGGNSTVTAIAQKRFHLLDAVWRHKS